MHVYKDGKLVVKWDLENQLAMQGQANSRILKLIAELEELIRRLGTSPAQFYRLLDQTNYKKSMDQLMALLQILECEVDLVVK